MRNFVFFGLGLLVAAGCAFDDDYYVDDEDDYGDAVPAIASLNSLDKNVMAVFGATTSPLLDQPLDQNATSAYFASSKAGRQLLEYASRCALDYGTSIDIVDSNGALHKNVGTGLIGLAPKWTKRGLTAAERGWLLGCMLSHVNELGIQIEISLRGYDPGGALATTAAERKDYRLYEGTFYGNFGDSNDDSIVLDMNACWGADLEKACPDKAALTAYLTGRGCATTKGTCKINVTGPCLASGLGTQVCLPGGDGHPEVCYSGPVGSGKKYAQPVSVNQKTLTCGDG